MIGHVQTWLFHAAYVALWAGIAALIYDGPVTLSFPALIAFAGAWFYLHREGEGILRDPDSAPWWDHLGDVLGPVIIVLAVWLFT